MMHGIVDEAQAAFIHGRYILDNVLEAHEIIYFAKKKNCKQSGIVYFDKAYDRVSSAFFERITIK
jgi:hypothetical protein